MDLPDAVFEIYLLSRSPRSKQTVFGKVSRIISQHLLIGAVCVVGIIIAIIIG